MMSVKVIVLCCVVLGMVAGTARAANPVVAVETSMGTFKVELFEDKAPVTVKNFLQYVEDKHYDGTIFHRVISDFMIQGGGFEPGMKEKKTRDPIKNEASNGLSNARGTLAMARTNDPDSATAQFFINVKDNDFLNHQNETARGFGYAVFGKVIEGMDVVDKIKEVKTEKKKVFDKNYNKDITYEDVPVEPVFIKSIKVKEGAAK